MSENVLNQSLQLQNEDKVLEGLKYLVKFRPKHELETKIQQTKMLVKCQRFGDLFLFGLSGSILQIRTNIIKVGLLLAAVI